MNLKSLGLNFVKLKIVKMTKSVSEWTSGELKVEAIDANINNSPYFVKI